MEALSLLTILSFFTSAASIALAVAAFIFGWRSFVRSSEMQMKAQASLEKISEKAEVIAKQTSGQIDKAWDYFTKTPTEVSPEETEELAKKEEEKRKKIIEDAKNETIKALEKAGVKSEVIHNLEEKVEGIIEKSTHETVKAGVEPLDSQISILLGNLTYSLSFLAKQKHLMTGKDITQFSVAHLTELLGDSSRAGELHMTLQEVRAIQSHDISRREYHHIIGRLARMDNYLRATII